MNLDNLLDGFAALLADPPVAATAFAVGCAFAIGQLWATALSMLTAIGLALTEHPLLCALVVLVITIAWLVDCARYPHRDCLRCRGAGTFKRGFWWFTTSKECRSCGGAGRKIRFGTNVLTRTFGDHFV